VTAKKHANKNLIVSPYLFCLPKLYQTYRINTTPESEAFGHCGSKKICQSWEITGAADG
jgi:hypothetical protein